MTASFNDYVEQFKKLSDQNIPYVLVTLTEVKGSAPQDPGAKMIVTERGLHFGTVGGGKVETKAIQESQNFLKNPKTKHFVTYDWNLQTDVGMTCGGLVTMSFEIVRPMNFKVTVFGAGHVAQAVVRLLCNLKCEVTCFDTRSEWIEKMPSHPRLKSIVTSELATEVKTIEPNSFVILMTMGHAHDSPVLIELMKTDRYPYVGVIGSLAKRNALVKDLNSAGITNHNFKCPIGLDIGDNSPEEIAISVVAELIQKRDQLN